MTDQPTIIAFQTGRHYTDKGQRIAATRLDNGRALFIDIDRGIDGVTTDNDDNLTKHRVMTCYDYGHYTVVTENTTGLGYDELEALLATLRGAAAFIA
jgi:hypothetical protein